MSLKLLFFWPLPPSSPFRALPAEGRLRNEELFPGKGGGPCLAPVVAQYYHPRAAEDGLTGQAENAS